jgi:uncharacterized protein (TIGR03032 family)
VPFHYVQTDSFVALLRQLKASLLVTTYQANKLLVVREDNGGLSALVRTFDRPVGLAADARQLALCTRGEIWLFRNASEIAPRLEPVGRHDACFLPRSRHVTGDISGHEVAWAGDELWVVNSRFSCLCTLHPDYSFVPRWRPPFITALAAEDRCHLSGLAMAPGERGVLTPRYVTALGESDTAGGWRPNKSHGGCLIDVPACAVVAQGLSMPHSPRVFDGRLWFLESGKGHLLAMDPGTGRQETITHELPGFARGLALHGGFAFIGLSKIRPTSVMDGVPLAKRRDELKCGVAAVDLESGRIVGFLEFQTAVEELFDVKLLPRLCFPEVLGFQKEDIYHTFVIPPEESAAPRGPTTTAATRSAAPTERKGQ